MTIADGLAVPGSRVDILTICGNCPCLEEFVAIPEESPNLPRQIGIYRLEEEIGSGAMGTVYRATHTTLHKEVALKIVQADDPTGEMCQRFLQEGVAASRVRHPNVVEVLDAGRDGQTAYMAMQLLEGETLSDCLKRQGRLPVTYAVDLILPVCAALMTAHVAGVLHRDLKPANIFLTDVGRGEPEPMLLDFGISKILGPVDAELTQNPKFLGTPLYIAPEQADGAPGSALSDQYSLALSLYESLLGVRPFEKYRSSLIQLLRHVAEGDIKPARELDASIPEELDEALCRATHKDPAARFPSLREFGAALLPFASAARRTLWEHSFVDAERTMTSANAPVSDSKIPRRVQVSVDDRASHSEIGLETATEPNADEFVSHSSLFADTGSESLGFNAGASSISRRDPSLMSERALSKPTSSYVDDEDMKVSGTGTDSSATDSLERPTYSSAPSDIPLSDPWGASSGDRANDSKRGAPPSRNSVGVLHPEEGGFALSWRSPWLWLFAAFIASATVYASVRLLDQEFGEGSPDAFVVELEVTPKNALIELDGQSIGAGRFRGSFARDGMQHQIRVSAEGYESEVVVFQGHAPPKLISLTPIERENSPSGNEDSGEGSKDNLGVSEEKPAKKKPKANEGKAGTRHQGAVQRPPAAQAPAKPENKEAEAAEAADPEAGASPSPPTTEKPEAKPNTPSHTGNLDPWAD